MHSKKQEDMGKSQKRHHRSVGPNVTINNIVTLDPEKYARSPSTSRLSQDSDYDRAKFLVEERARYWRDLKILYNDYTLVKLKQKELLDSEDNYVNQHCIEETVKLSSALKRKIQAKCKDIIFITHLCGNSDVNRVVQSLADGEDIDRVLIKKQKSASKSRDKKNKSSSAGSKVKGGKKTSVEEVEEEDEEQEVSAPPPPPPAPVKRKSAVNEPKFFDSELHWCQYCNVFPPTIKKYLQHLHEESHKKKIKELKINESPWHKCLPEEQAWRTDSTDSVHVKAFNFFVPTNGWFCQLCRSWMGDIHCAATHLRSYVHNMNLKNFQEKFPNWKKGWLDERSKALEKTFECRKESSIDSVQNSVEGKKKDESESSSGEEESAEPISRHRTTKSKMWVPNQKAFERVCNETNPIPQPTPTESSLNRIKVSKKDRPPFIGKMPLISTINKSKKIVMKELPQNTTEKIASSCAESDKIQKQQDELRELIVRRNEEENDLKLKEFIRVAKKIKKGSRKKNVEFGNMIAAECYNATEFVPVVETTDPIENLIGPPALVAQWEADANYEYHMRQLHHYNMTSQMMQMPQPQTFLLDPYHAIALHNQQYYNSTHMISNQYENFEIISREDEEVYSQYMDFQNSPSSSPSIKMFTGKLNPRSDDVNNVPTGENDIGHKDQSRLVRPTEPAVRQPSTQEDIQDVKFKKPQSKDKLSSEISPKKTSKKTNHIIQKPALLNIPSSNDLMPTFKETFLNSADNIPSSGYISALLSTCADVKIVSANEVYKKKIAPSKRRKIRKKRKQCMLGETEKSVEDEEHAEAIAEPHGNELQVAATTDRSPSKQGKNLSETPNNDDMPPSSESTQQDPTPRKKPTISLKDKINSIRKAIDRNKVPDTVEEKPVKRSRPVKFEEEMNIEDTSSRTEDKAEQRASRDSELNVEQERYDRVREDSDDSEEDGDDAKLIYYDMTSI
ncbi:hypothetical protein M8J76_015952 [Diaphorina citri]|nr:hypothetical protein M8J76_015952 [Diaphorina citri]